MTWVMRSQLEHAGEFAARVGWPADSTPLDVEPVDVTVETPLDDFGRVLETFELVRVLEADVQVATRHGMVLGQAGSSVMRSNVTGEQFLVHPDDLASHYVEV